LNLGTVTGPSNDSLFSVVGILGTAFPDTIKGNNLDNRIFGGRGADIIDGRSGNDWITSDGVRSILKGGAGDDSITPGAGGAAVIDGGLGIDTLVLQYQPAGAVVDLVGQTMTIGGATSRSFAGFESLFGTPFDDTLIGFDGDNVLQGDTGNDTIRGAGGRDKLWGGAGDDILDGGDGTDRCGDDLAVTTLISCEETRNITSGD
jgi:Ca2+-binding RTX toxin-like protein